MDHPSRQGHAPGQRRQVVLAVEIQLQRRHAYRRIAVERGIRGLRQHAFDPADAAHDTQSLDGLAEQVDLEPAIALLAVESKHPRGRIEEAAWLFDLETSDGQPNRAEIVFD